MNTKKTIVGSILAASIGISGIAGAADLVLGVPNWPSVKATGEILKHIIEENLGVEVEIQNATNPIVFEAMDSGSMHVHPEVWMPNQQNLHDTYVTEKRSVTMNPNGVVAFQGMCVTKDTAERTGITDLVSLSDPETAALFDTDGDGKGNIWIGAAGWASTNVERVRAKSYGYDETMNLDVMDESLAMAQVDAAVTRGDNIVFFCYTPHHMFALHELIPLIEPKHDPAKWNVLQPTDDPDWLEKSSAPVAWTVARLHIMYASDLEKDQPEVANFLSKVKLDTGLVTEMTYAVIVEKRDMSEYAVEWVEGHSDLVESWLR
ncbi:MAG: hypothetical protein OXI60_10450 [Acidiferrobacterales bacterium]|nr:hypothetical protein [Acidiferrobacterales bacterium]